MAQQGGDGAAVPAAQAAPAGQAAPNLLNIPLLETDMTSHLYFEMDRFKGKSPHSPVTHSVADWLQYWEAKQAVFGVARTIEKAICYIAPASRAVFNEAIAMSKLQHNRADWNLFRDTIKRTFQISKSDIVTHPLRDNNWLLRIPTTGTKNNPRNQALRIFCNSARKPLKQLSSMLFDGQRHIRRASFVHAETWLRDMRLLEDGANLPGQLQAGHRVCTLIGMAWAIQLQALHSFRHQFIPAVMADKYADIMEEHMDLTQQCQTDIMEGLLEELATFLTTQQGISGPSLLERSRSGGNQSSQVNKQKNKSKSKRPPKADQTTTPAKETQEEGSPDQSSQVQDKKDRDKRKGKGKGKPQKKKGEQTSQVQEKPEGEGENKEDYDWDSA